MEPCIIVRGGEDHQCFKCQRLLHLSYLKWTRNHADFNGQSYRQFAMARVDESGVAHAE